MSIPKFRSARHTLFLSVALLLAGNRAPRLGLTLPATDGEAFETSSEKRADSLPSATLRWRADQLRSEDGSIAPRGLEIALAQARRNRAAARQALSVQASALNWQARGPNNVGGRSRSLVIDPRNSSVLYIAAVTGGVWKSIDAGGSWQPLTDFMPSLAANALVIDPHRPDTLYVGTGEGGMWDDSFRGLGVYRSDDAGASWQSLPATIAWTYTNRLLVSPADRQILFATTRGGIRRSLSGGASWSTVYPASMAWDIKVDPNDPNTLLATVFDAEPGSDGLGSNAQGPHRLLRSSDGGTHWSVVYEVWGEASVDSSSPSHAPIGRGLCGRHSRPICITSRPLEVGRSRRQLQPPGRPVSLVRDARRARGQQLLLFPLAIASRRQLLIVGGAVAFRSTDGGLLFDSIAPSRASHARQAHVDDHLAVEEAAFNGSTNRRLYLLSTERIHRTEDITATDVAWDALNSSYETSQFYGACGYGPTGTLAGGTQDNAGAFMGNGLRSVCPIFPRLWGRGPVCVRSATREHLLRDRHLGPWSLRYDAVAGSVNIRPPALPGNPGDEYSDLNPHIVLDPNDPRRMYVPIKHLWRSDNVRDPSAPSWQAIFNSVVPGPRYLENITALAVVRGDSNQLWLAQSDHRLFHTSNGLSPTPTWTPVDDNGALNPLPNRKINDLWTDRFDPQTVYAALGGFAGDNLYRTRDGGVTWQDITGNGSLGLPDAPVYSIVQHPTQRNWLYVGTEVGVFSSFDAGNTWIAAPSGPANVIVYDLSFLAQSNTLLAATFGRGLWTLDTSPLLPDGSCTPDDQTLCLGGGRFLVRANWQDGQGHGADAHAQLLTADTGYFWFFNSANVELIVKILDGCGLSHHQWIFTAGLTNTAVDLVVIDTLTGANHVYHNPAGQAFQPIQDLDGLDGCGAAAVKAEIAAPPVPALDAVHPRAETAAGACTASATALCLSQGRFRVETTWRTPDGVSGTGQAIPITGDTGYFWFFSSASVEVVVKMVDACGYNQKFWVFAAGLTNVEVTTTVTDTLTGSFKRYHNTAGQAFQPIQDTSALGCP